MRDGLAEALLFAATDPTIVEVVLTGAGPSFSSGGDLDEFGTFPDPAASHLVRLTRSPARLLARVADRVVTHLHGACMGAGIELAAFGHRVEAEPDTLIALPELALGLVPGAGGTVSLPEGSAVIAPRCWPSRHSRSTPPPRWRGGWSTASSPHTGTAADATSAARCRRRPRSSGR